MTYKRGAYASLYEYESEAATTQKSTSTDGSNMGGNCACAEADSLLILAETAIAESMTDGNGTFLTDNNGEIFIF